LSHRGGSISPGTTCFLLCYGNNDAATSKLQNSQIASFRDNIEDDIITAKVRVL
jgi:hypothetical protein